MLLIKIPLVFPCAQAKDWFSNFFFFFNICSSHSFTPCRLSFPSSESPSTHSSLPQLYFLALYAMLASLVMGGERGCPLVSHIISVLNISWVSGWEIFQWSYPFPRDGIAPMGLGPIWFSAPPWMLGVAFLFFSMVNIVLALCVTVCCPPIASQIFSSLEEKYQVELCAFPRAAAAPLLHDWIRFICI